MISYINTIKYLLLKSVHVASYGIKDKMFNSLFWSTLNIIIFTYVMPQMGLDQSFGAFIVATMPISCAFFTSINSIYMLLTDITSEGSALTYELSLPVPQWMIFAKYALENMYQALCVSVLILPWGHLLLWNQQVFSGLAWIAYLKFYTMLFVASFFFGFYSIFVTSITRDVYYGLDNVWIRIIFPMWFLGGFQFSWKTLYTMSPMLAYINLLNPVMYALEGGRAAVLDPQLSLPYGVCLAALLVFTGVFGYVGIRILKKRLDCL